MVEITFTGDTIVDVAEQARAFADAVLGVKAQPAKQRARRGEGAPQVDPPSEPEAAPAVEPEAVEQTAPAADAPADTKALEKIREQALTEVRTLYAAGKEGQAASKKIAPKFDVKKLTDVPVEKAQELLDAVRAAAASIAK